MNTQTSLDFSTPPAPVSAEPVPEDPIFGKVIYAYTRKQAIEDGQQVEVTETAREAGITFRTFMTRTVWAQYVEVPPGVTCQDERGRLWDIVWMCRFGIRAAADGQQRINFQLRVRRKGGVRRVPLAAVVGPVDMDDPAPAITIMLPDED
jgi:hypothetical protein